MNPNPTLKKLGFSDNDRVAIIHADDIGMSHASYAAFTDLWNAGIISSAATMAPCPWFPQVAAHCRANPHIDIGVHLTLTSEWDGFRWGPISSRDPATGMLDDEGYFPRTASGIQQSGDPEAIQRELFAQIERAIAAGITPTHVDTHMGSVFHPKYMHAYVQLAVHFKIPVMIPRLDEHELRNQGFDGESTQWMVKKLHALEDELEGEGLPLIDHVSWMPLDKPENRMEQAFTALDALQPGITHFIIHPSYDTPEARAIGPDWPSRVGDYETFMDERVREHIQKTGVQVIGYRALKQTMD
jgi:hypothetical protein